MEALSDNIVLAMKCRPDRKPFKPNQRLRNRVSWRHSVSGFDPG